MPLSIFKRCFVPLNDTYAFFELGWIFEVLPPSSDKVSDAIEIKSQRHFERLVKWVAG